MFKVIMPATSVANSIQLDPFGHNQTKAPTFLARHLYTHRTCAQAPAFTCTILPSFPKHWRRSFCFLPIGRRRSTFHSPITARTSPAFRQQHPCTSDKRKQMCERARSFVQCESLEFNAGGRGCWMSLCAVMGREVRGDKGGRMVCAS